MAPTKQDVELQTYDIIQCLFDDDGGADARGCNRSDSLETDGPGLLACSCFSLLMCETGVM